MKQRSADRINLRFRSTRYKTAQSDLRGRAALSPLKIPHSVVPAASRGESSLLLLCIMILATFVCHAEIVTVLYLGTQISKKYLTLSILFLLLCSDLMIHLTFHSPMFGSWTLFTYSGFFLIGLSAHWAKLSPKRWGFLWASLGSSLFFWLWTNSESWAFSGMYPLTTVGLLQCYTFALPFLFQMLGTALIVSGLCVGYLKVRHQRCCIIPA